MNKRQYGTLAPQPNTRCSQHGAVVFSFTISNLFFSKEYLLYILFRLKAISALYKKHKCHSLPNDDEQPLCSPLMLTCTRYTSTYLYSFFFLLTYARPGPHRERYRTTISTFETFNMNCDCCVLYFQAHGPGRPQTTTPVFGMCLCRRKFCSYYV